MSADQRSRRPDHAPGRGLPLHAARPPTGARRDDLPPSFRPLRPSRRRRRQSGFHAWVSVLKSVSAYEAYLKAHDASLDPTDVLQFLLLDQEFPAASSTASSRSSV